MLESRYKDAEEFLNNLPALDSQGLFIKANCLMKQGNYYSSIIVLNEAKRNQLSKKIKIRALLMKMKVHKKLKRYDLAYKDALNALGMMNEK